MTHDDAKHITKKFFSRLRDATGIDVDTDAPSHVRLREAIIADLNTFDVTRTEQIGQLVRDLTRAGEIKAALMLERDQALNNRLPPEARPAGGNPPWTATQTANYWGNQARQLEEKVKSLTERLDEACMKTVKATTKLMEMEAAYKVLLQHLKAGHVEVQCRLCHPALVERDEAVLKLATLVGGLKALLENHDGQ